MDSKYSVQKKKGRFHNFLVIDSAYVGYPGMLENTSILYPGRMSPNDKVQTSPVGWEGTGTICELIRKSLSLNLCLHLYFHGRRGVSKIGIGLDMGGMLRHILCEQRGAKRGEAEEEHLGTGAVSLCNTEFTACSFMGAFSQF